jgi:hypothetical protein
MNISVFPKAYKMLFLSILNIPVENQLLTNMTYILPPSALLTFFHCYYKHIWSPEIRIGSFLTLTI